MKGYNLFTLTILFIFLKKFIYLLLVVLGLLRLSLVVASAGPGGGRGWHSQAVVCRLLTASLVAQHRLYSARASVAVVHRL